MDKVINSSDSDTNSVTKVFANTHCLVCGKAFSRIRLGKSYCSNKCKQFAFNHKSEFTKVTDLKNSTTTISFDIEQFKNYDKNQKLLKKYRELEKRTIQFDQLEQEIKFKTKIGVPIADYIWQRYGSAKLTESEEMEHYNACTELEENIIDLNLKELSIEQWSFIKTLQPDLDEGLFYIFISSLSNDFISHLNLKLANEDNKSFIVIKNKFIHHCNLIAEGRLIFVKK